MTLSCWYFFERHVSVFPSFTGTELWSSFTGTELWSWSCWICSSSKQIITWTTYKYNIMLADMCWHLRPILWLTWEDFTKLYFVQFPEWTDKIQKHIKCSLKMNKEFNAIHLLSIKKLRCVKVPFVVYLFNDRWVNAKNDGTPFWWLSVRLQ